MEKDKIPLKEDRDRNDNSKEILDVASKDDIESIKKFFSNPDMFVEMNKKIFELDVLDKNRKEVGGEYQKKIDQASNKVGELFGLKNSSWLTSITHKDLHSVLAQMKADIAKEFQCQNSLELMIADRIVANYWKAMRYDVILGNAIDNDDCAFNPDRSRLELIKMALKVAYLSNRQLSRDIILLKSLKEPQVRIEVNTGTTYIAQNQQINNHCLNKDNSTDSIPIKSMIPDDLGKTFLAEECQKIEINSFLKGARTQLREVLIKSELKAHGIVIELTTSKTGFGGCRYWFKCPVCSKRVGTLFLHPISQNLGCRTCLGLEYRKRRYKGMIESR